MQIGTTLKEHLLKEKRRHPEAADSVAELLADLTLPVKFIASLVQRAGLLDVRGAAGSANVQGEEQQKLDVIANDALLDGMVWTGHLAGMASEEMDEPHGLPDGARRGRYLLLFDPLDGSSNIDVNISVGTIFSVLEAPVAGRDATLDDFLQPGVKQVCAGYAVYGSSTMLVYSRGFGVHGFTLDPGVGEFILSHPDMHIPADSKEYAINASNQRFWEAPVQRYVDEAQAGESGPRGKDFNMRWVGSMVADVHRILCRGGVFMYPFDTKDPKKPGKLRLMYEANPMSFLVEQAGGAANTGRERILDIRPTGLHQRVPVILGSKHEVERIVAYHGER